MTRDTEPVLDADLHAWADGRLDPARRATVDRHLVLNPALRRRVEDWAAQAATLRDALHRDDEAGRPTLMARLSRISPAPASGRRAALAAGLLLALALGGAGGWMAHGEPRPSEISRLGVEAATAYRTLDTEPGPVIEVSADNRAGLRALLAQRLGRLVRLPDLSSMGYRLVNGRVLAAIHGPAALLVYADDAGNRMTVYVQPMQVGAPAPMRALQTDALNGYAWIDRQIGYTVMSDEPKDRVHAAADHVRAEGKL